MDEHNGSAAEQQSDTILAKIQRRLDYTFTQPALLQQALTHPSYAHEHADASNVETNNQRLEFLGDAVLDFLVAAWLYRTYPDAPEGQLTRLRATLVCTTSLATLALELGVGQALHLGRGEEDNGGRLRPANLCDALEAVVGALYLDGGLDVVWVRLAPWFASEVARILQAVSYVDAKSRFQEWAQAERAITPTYRIVHEYGPDHAKVFTAEVLLGDTVVGAGEGHSKRLAEQAAAENALQQVVV